MEPNSSQEQQAASLGAQGTQAAWEAQAGHLEGDGSKIVAQLHNRCEISILGGLQDSATPSHGWSSIEDNLGDISCIQRTADCHLPSPQ